MTRRHYPQQGPPPVAAPPVPDARKRRRLSRAERRAWKEGQMGFPSLEGCPQGSAKRKGE